MQITQSGLDIIKNFEGFSAKAYLCPARKWTIGYGHMIKPGEDFPGLITVTEAEQLLLNDVQIAVDAVVRMVTATLSQNQVNALISFTYNLGAGALGGSTLLQVLNAGDYASAAQQFLRWDHVNGVQLAGLTARREAESQLFLTPDE